MNELERTGLDLIVSSTDIALREVSQVARCLTIAMLEMLKEAPDKEAALKQISEIAERLEEAEKYMARAHKVVEDIKNAAQ